MDAKDFDWGTALREQVEWHWGNQLEPRLAGLTDDEYFWSPVPGAWSVRPRGPQGAGKFVMDHALPGPTPAPFTTIAWRLGHVIAGVLATRNAAHFGAPATSTTDWAYAGTAAEALDQLRTQLDIWLAGLRALDEDGLRAAVGDKEPYPTAPMAELILHINRELIHHLAEIALLRDLYLHTHQ